MDRITRSLLVTWLLRGNVGLSFHLYDGFADTCVAAGIAAGVV